MRKNLVFLSVLFLVSQGFSEEYYVDQKHQVASDNNPGSEDLPWKTIQKAADSAVAGDTVWIKGGEYCEDVKIKNDGEYKNGERKFITFAAWGDEPVKVLGTRKVAADEWRLVEGQENVFSVPYTDPFNPPTQIFIDGKRIPEAVKVVGIDEKTGEEVSPDAKGLAVRRQQVFYEVTDSTPNYWAIDTKNKHLLVNAGGGNSATGRIVEISDYEFSLDNRQYIRIKGLRLHRMKLGMHGSGSHHCIIEDCLVTEAGGDIHWRNGGAFAGIYLSGTNNIIRRNTILDSQFQGIYWSGHSYIIEDNLINRCDLHPAILPDQWYGVLKTNGGSFSTVRNNVIVDAKSPGIAAAGIWCDIGTEFNAIYGNTVAHQGMGIYAEYTQNFNFIGFNVLQDLFAGVGLRANNWNFIYENYINRCTRGITAWETYRNPVMTDVRATHNWLIETGHFAIAFDPPRKDKMAGSHDYNVFWPENQTIAASVPGPGNVSNIKDVRTLTGNEMHGEVRKPTEAELRLLRFRIPYAENPDELLPMLANPTLLRHAPTGQGGIVRPYFWRQGWGDGSLASDIYPGWSNLLEPSRSTGVIIDSSGAWTQEWEEARGKETTRDEYHWGLKVEGLIPRQMHKLGDGWWTPTIPTVAGTKYTIRLSVRAKDLKPFAEKHGPVAFALWTNDTGQEAVYSFIMGIDDSGKMSGALPPDPTFGWTEVQGNVTAPTGATRVAFFLGLRRCKGIIGYDNIWIESQ